MFGSLKNIRGLWPRALLLAYYWFALVVAVLLPLWVGNALVNDAGVSPIPALLGGVGIAAVIGWFEFLFLRRHLETWVVKKYSPPAGQDSQPVP